MTNVGSKISYVGLKVVFVKRTRGRTCKVKDFDVQVSTQVRRVREYEKSEMEPGTCRVKWELVHESSSGDLIDFASMYERIVTDDFGCTFSFANSVFDLFRSVFLTFVGTCFLA